jgi:Ca-activated chloride channel family protein
MTVLYPLMLLVAVLVTGAGVAAYVALQRQRSGVLRAAGLDYVAASRRVTVRRHLPYALFLAALPLLLVALARPEAQIAVPRVGGTVILVFDVSASMAADDVKPSRLAAAKDAAAGFVQAQPSTVDMGVVIFGQDGLTTQKPTDDHNAVLSAISRLTPGGGTSLRQAILSALTAIVGHPVNLPGEAGGQQPADLGYWGSATIVLFSDGQDTAGSGAGDASGSDVEAAAELAASAGVRIETVGIGTTRGTTVKVDGYQVATALDEELLTNLAATTGGSYHPAQDAAAVNQIYRSIDLRITTQPETVELTGLFTGLALVMLTAGGLLMIRWHGRIV